MTHDEFVSGIRERYSELFNPTNTEQDWRYLISIGPGWWQLLTNFCEQLEGILKHHDETGKWYIRQCKEKFGEIRIYVRPVTEPLNADWYPETLNDIDSSPVQDLLSDLRSQITEQANVICEECGDPGGLRVLNGWYRTCCDRHYQEWQDRKGSK